MESDPKSRFQTISEMRAALTMPGPATRQTFDEIHTLVKDALNRRKWVYMTYTNLKGITRCRNALPLALSPTYLKAFCELSHRPLTFHVGRISFASIEEAKAVPPLPLHTGVYIRPTSDQTVRSDQPKWVPDPGPYLASGQWEIVTPPCPSPSPSRPRLQPATPPPQPRPVAPSVRPKQPGHVVAPAQPRPSSSRTPTPQPPALRLQASSAGQGAVPAPPSASRGAAKPATRQPAARPPPITGRRHLRSRSILWILGAAAVLIALFLVFRTEEPQSDSLGMPPSGPTTSLLASPPSPTPFATRSSSTITPPQPTTALIHAPTLTPLSTTTPIPTPGSPSADLILAYNPGPGARSEYQDPDALLGPPDIVESPQLQGVLQLGRGGSVLVAFSDNAVVDGDGPDFKVYGESMRDDYLQVEVSADGEIWHAYPRASESPPGFDLAEAGLNRAVFVRLTDLQPATPSGAEVDAIVALHNGPVLQSRLPTLPDAIAGQDLTLYERPATEKQMSGSVARGQPLDLLGRDDQGEWAKVRTTRGAPTQGWCSVTGLVLNVSLRDLSPLIISTTPTPKSAQVSPTKTVAYPVPSNTPDSAGSPWILVADSKTDYPGPTQNRKWWYLWSTNRYTFNWQDMQWDDSTYCYRSSSNENMRICKDQITNNGRGDVALLWKARQGGTYRFEWDSGALLFYQHLGFVGAQGPGPTLANSAIVYDVIDWELFFWVARTNTPYHVRVHRLKE